MGSLRRNPNDASRNSGPAISGSSSACAVGLDLAQPSDHRSIRSRLIPSLSVAPRFLFPSVLACAVRRSFRGPALVVAAGLWFAPFVRPADPPAGPPERPLEVSAATDHYPYSFEEEPGRITGFAVDLFDAVARRMALTLHRTGLPALDELRRFDGGEFDVAEFRHRRPGRDLNIEYTAPVLVLQGAIFVRTGDRRFATMEDLRTKQAQVAASTQGFDFAVARGLAQDHLQTASSPDGLRLLSEGRVDAVLVTHLTGIAQAVHLGIRNVEPVGPSLDGFTVRYCLAVHKGNDELLARLNEGLAVLHQSGEFEQIYQKWFGRFEPRRFTWLQMISLIAAFLAVALALVLWALVRQRQLRRRIAHQAEELAENQGILADAQQFARVGHWRSAVDGRTDVVWSAETYRIFGRDPREVAPDIEGLTAYAAAADRMRWRQAWAASLQDGRSHEMDVVIEPQPGLRKTVHVRGRPVLDAAGRRIGLFGTVQDVTAWRAAEQALRQSEQLLRALYDNLPVSLVVLEWVDNDWRVVSFNPQAGRWLRLVEKSSIGQPMSVLGLNPELHEAIGQLIQKCLADETDRKKELFTADDQRYTAVTVVRLGRDSDRPRCCFLAEDVTERKQKDAEIAQSRRLRAVGELVGGIAHEFNNLLTPILMKADLLQVEWAHHPGLSEELKAIVAAARRSAELTRRLLAFGRKADVQPELLDLRAVVGANLDLVRHTIDRRIRIESAVPADLPALFLNSGDLHQVILNLLLNARDTLLEKLTLVPPGGWSACIRIEAESAPAEEVIPPIAPPEPPRTWIRLTVRDNGCGMTPAVLERIFEPFFTTKQVGQGTGLGLATVWHLVTGMHGRIDVESVLGEGSAFHVSLPILPRRGQSRPPIAPKATGSSAKPSAPRRLMLVEDEEAIARVVCRLLEREGHAVTVVSNGLQAWEALAAHPEAFHGVIMDLNMPGISGLELARRARALPFEGPLVIMSGRVTEEDRAELEHLRIDAFLEKPFTVESFRVAIDPILRSIRD